jgi:hypothetical protein
VEFVRRHKIAIVIAAVFLFVLCCGGCLTSCTASPIGGAGGDGFHFADNDHHKKKKSHKPSTPRKTSKPKTKKP